MRTKRLLTTLYNIQDIGYTTACWIWIAGKSGNYGVIKRDGKCLKAHVYFYRQFKTEIPKGLVLDHLCRNTLCVNPDHLEPVTQDENMRRGYGYSAINARKTSCSRGHEYSEENTYYYKDGRRDCKQCIELRSKRKKRLTIFKIFKSNIRS